MERTIDEITGGHRLRRLRKASWSRRLVSETRLAPQDLVWSLFLCEGSGIREPVAALPGVMCYSVDAAVEEVLRAAEFGIAAVAPFAREPLKHKSLDGGYIRDPDNLTNRFCREMKKHKADIGVITDSALDPYTSHGHDGILRNGIVDNDESVAMIVAGSLAQARSGSDIIAPSDMMDGRIGAIRTALDREGFQQVAILSYACKFASHFYGPYREAVGTRNLLQGDKKTYYLDPSNGREALREARQDIIEAADMLMVKPALPYLDIIQNLRSQFSQPLFAFQVSGEYAMIKMAAQAGLIDGDGAMMEALLACKRAGCDGIFTYYAREAAQKLQAGHDG